MLNTTPTADTAQLRWLEEDLADHPALCTLAITHRPRFSSGNTGSSPVQGAVFQRLYDAGVEILLSGNDHDYERFAPQAPDQTPDPAGVVQFVVGTGGKSHGRINLPLAPNSVAQNDDTYGLLRLVLPRRVERHALHRQRVAAGGVDAGGRGDRRRERGHVQVLRRVGVDRD